MQHLPNGCFKPPIQRAGQAINDELFGGVSSTDFGTLTFGRQRALGTDAMLLYDPAGGAYSFSFIGYNGLMAGGGDTQDTRLDNAVKYRIASGALHFGAMYKFADGDGGCYSAAAAFTAATCAPQRSHNSAYAVDFGGLYGSFSADLVVQHVNQAISVVNPLLGPTSLTQPYQSTTDSINTQPITSANLIGTTNTEYGIVTDNTAVMAAAKYTWERFKFYGGYEHIVQVNPSNPLGIGARAQGDYQLSGVEDNNLDSPKIVQVAWTGAKYAIDSKTDVTLSYYREWQNDFREPRSCSPAAGFRSSCAGNLDEISLFVDHHFSSGSISTAASHILMSAAVWRSPSLMAQACPITTTPISPRHSADVSPSDRANSQLVSVAEAETSVRNLIAAV